MCATSSAERRAARVYIPGVFNGKNRTFWFTSYEAFPPAAGRYLAASPCPTEAMRNGDFSNVVNAASGTKVNIYNP